MAIVRNVVVLFSANTGMLSAGLANASRQVNAFASGIERTTGRGARGFTTMQAAIAGTTLAITAITTGVGLMAASFERNMRNVNSLAKESERNFRAMSDAVLEMSTRYPQSADTLAEGLYDLVSSGLEGADALYVLEQAAVSATAGMSDTETAAEAITAVINAFGYSASEAGRISDTLFQTVNYGIVTFEELSNELGDVVGTAAAAGQSIEEVGAAIATMTLSGLGADEAAVSLNRVLQAIIKPSGEMNNVLRTLGYESGAAALQQKGLYEVMSEVESITGANITALLRLFPEIRSSRGALALLSNEGEQYARVFGNITDANTSAGATMAAYEEQLKSTTVQAQLFFETIRAELIKAGQLTLPLAQFALNEFPGPLVIAGLKAFVDLLEISTEFISENREAILATAAAIGATIVPALWAQHAATTATTISTARLLQLMVVQRFTAMGNAISGLASSFMTLHPAVRIVSIGLTTAAGVWAMVSKANREAEERVRGFTDAIEADSGAIAENTRLHAARMLQESDAIEVAREHGIELSTLTDAVLGEAEAQQTLREQLELIAELSGERTLLFGVEASGQGFDTEGVRDLMSEVLRLASELETAAGEAEELGELVGDDLSGASDQARAAIEALEQQVGRSAHEMASDLGIDLDQLEKMAQAIQRVQAQARQGILGDSDVISGFDPMADLSPQQTPEQLRARNLAEAQRNMQQAERGLADARRSATQAAQAIGDAEYDLRRAREDVGRTTEDNAKRLQDAYDAVEDAQRGVHDAQRDALEAEEALTEARRDAIEALEEQRRAVADQAAEQEDGIIAVVRAREKLRELEAEGADELTLREARNALANAEKASRDLRDTHLEERRTLDEMTRAGVEGSQSVIEARENVREAEEAIQAAMEKQAEAAANIANVQVENSRRVEDARRGVERAERGVADARQRAADAAVSIADAEREVVETTDELNAALLNMASSSERLRIFYEEQTTRSEKFVADVQRAVERGLDPDLAVRLLEAGPEKAMPILEAMLNDHSDRTIEMVNDSEIRLNEIADHAADTALALQMSMHDAGEDMKDELRDAMRILAEIGRKGGAQVSSEIAEELNIGAGRVREISDKFGLALADSINPILEAIGEDPIKPSGHLGSKGVNGTVIDSTTGGGGIPNQYAAGGYVDGPDVRKDVVRALLMPREFVQTRDATDYYGVDYMSALNKRQIPRDAARSAMGMGLNRFAAGGLVTGDTEGLHPEFLRRLAAWAAAQGTPYHVGSGYRSIAEQAVLYDRWVRGVPGQAQAAPPGRSNHNFGLASDGPRWRARNPGAFGLRYPMSYEPWHVEPNEARAMRGTHDPMFGHTMYSVTMPELPETPNGLLGEAAGALMKHARDAAGHWAAANAFMTYDEETGTFMPFSGVVDASGFTEAVSRWAPQVGQVLGMLNQSLDNVANILLIIKHESGGNPRAINNWDSNAAKGQPSQGLMQTIPSTFEAYRNPDLSSNIMDPLANIYAGTNYGISRYGSIANIPGVRSTLQGGGYRPYAGGGLVQRLMDKGGVLPMGLSLVDNRTGDLEAFGSSKMRRYAQGGLVAPTPMLRGDPTLMPLIGAPDVSGVGSASSLEDLEAALDSLEQALQVQEDTARAQQEIVRLEELRNQKTQARLILEMAEADVLAQQNELATIQAQIMVQQLDIRHYEESPEERAAVEKRLEELLADQAIAQQELIILTESRDAAQQALVESTADLTRGEREATIAAEERAIAEEQARLEVEARIASNREEYLFDQMNAEDQLAWIQERLQAERMYSDEWIRLKQQEQQLLDEIMGDRIRGEDDLAKQLDRILDRYIELTDRATRLQEDFVEAQEEALREVHLAIDRAQQEADKALIQIVQSRQQAFSQAMPITQRFVEGWGNTARALTGNITQQIEIFQKWRSTLDELRSRGVTEGVIEALGLENIENIGDATMLLRATDAELAQLNQVYETRQNAFTSRAEQEQYDLLGAVGQATIETRRALQAEIDKLWIDYHESIDQMQQRLDEQLAEIYEEIGELGMETGRTYAERMAEALETGLPAVIELARRYEQALRDAERARAQLGESNMRPVPGALPGTIASGGRLPVIPTSTSARDAALNLLGIPTYDSGGVWPAGTLGFNAGRGGWGGTEEVLSPSARQQMEEVVRWAALAQSGGSMGVAGQAPTVNVFIGNEKLDGRIEVVYDRQAQRYAGLRVSEGVS